MQNNAEKFQLRKTMSNTLHNYINNDADTIMQDRFNAQTIHTFQNFHEFVHANIVLAYFPMKYEASCMNLLLLSQKNKKEIALPRIENDTMNFYYCNNVERMNNFTQNSYGIYEPKSDNLVDLEKIILTSHRLSILVIVPGLAFTKDGKRLGRGKGYYDRFLSTLIKLKEKHSNVYITLTMIGLCFPFQLIEKIPTEDHDVSMDYVLCEEHLYICKK